jgi:putative transposase
MIAYGSRPAISPALPNQRPCLAGPVRGLPIEDDDPPRTVVRYVERNALRAELVARAEDWKWLSLPRWVCRDSTLWNGEPEVRDRLWPARVNEPLSGDDLHWLRLSAEQGRPFGDESWVPKTARRLGLESTL